MIMRVLNKDIYSVLYFEAESQSQLLLTIYFEINREDYLVEAINMDFDWDDDEGNAFKATVVVSR